jgi:hypothetical protein
MGGDQFSKTFRSGVVERITDRSSMVNPLYRVAGKKVERRRSQDQEADAESAARAREQYRQYSEVQAPRSDLWDMVIDSVERFNERQDLRNSPYAVRIWAQNAGFRVQIIEEATGRLVKQSRLIPFKDLSAEDLNDIINSLIGERGVVIDLVR